MTFGDTPFAAISGLLGLAPDFMPSMLQKKAGGKQHVVFLLFFSSIWFPRDYSPVMTRRSAIRAFLPVSLRR